MQSVIGSLFCGALASLLWLIAGNVALAVVAVLSGIFGSVMMCTKDENYKNSIDFLFDELECVEPHGRWREKALSKTL